MSDTEFESESPGMLPIEEAVPSSAAAPVDAPVAPAPIVVSEPVLTLADHVADLAEQFATYVDVVVELKEELRGIRHAIELLTVPVESRNGYLQGDRIEYKIGEHKNYGAVERMRPQDAQTAMLGIEWENGQVGEVGSRNAGMTRLPRPISEPRPQFASMEPEPPPATAEDLDTNETEETP